MIPYYTRIYTTFPCVSLLFLYIEPIGVYAIVINASLLFNIFISTYPQGNI